MVEASFLKLPHKNSAEGDESGLLVDYEALRAQSGDLSRHYRSNAPFPHIVIDDFLPSRTIDRLIEDYPYDQSLPVWNDATHRHKDTGEFIQKDKRNIRDLLRMPPSYRQLIWELNSHYFLDFLSKLSGIKNLLPDPNLRGAGIHQIGTGGFLKVHADFTLQRDFALSRRINLLLYLNRDWPEEYGGHLELWDREIKGPPKRVLPIANRCVIFSTTADSFHGHPKPLTCPEGVYRKSIALYFYTNGRPDDKTPPVISTDWRDTPF
ncbi:2OG-Fe(II) oxygenase [Parvibaculum sp.]|jgi:Rps23 Pro-64 3,4-dihydroxylase Tpa1-like proline 4-hydroxylase|uniref:2OG-Fe(II) oxygenase n=1 Tax=Parvibaculum sp. TaxID=2024848 RepID=UPI000C3C6CED|nr:2OG-Fe(II) oxygenase [Parvibaculum sp.]HAC57075.1 proline hydroxylase [Rhodobiaceae bacterium]MAU61249.1 proline hydroxylase [Parvibaculum sp.]MAU62428.1 proline hydroxylase [Parvibaculum sp.]MBO6667321.1 2OG-Fe(II) oxygenase [Parvibaculum sp.]MBO6691450.1 2OG-Fe(II) oxygenase [Parvibaculum sp.]|tara:strand:+ start:1788 stop:2582 length:795 start_codon:yes stop_codon:yes gene_type:complete